VAFATKSSFEFFKNELLADDDLLCCVLISICARLTLLLRIKDDSKLGRFQWSVDELKSAISCKPLIIVGRGLLHQLLLLGRIRHHYDRCIAVACRAVDLVHDGVNLISVVKDKYNMGENDWTFPTKHPLSAEKAFFASDLVWDTLRKGILDVSDGGFPTVLQGANNKN